MKDATDAKSPDMQQFASGILSPFRPWASRKIGTISGEEGS